MSTTTPTPLTELIIVCGHATFTGSRAEILTEAQWTLQPFQRSDPATNKRGEHLTFISHILSATFAAASRPSSLLIFSGGRTTTPDSDPDLAADAVSDSPSGRTEAQGYEQVHLGLDHPFGIGDRYAREDFATDSFQNLLFSILRFRQVVGRYPRDITVVTHAFKRDRIVGVHALALRWPHDRIRLQGIDPSFTSNEYQNTIAGEKKAEGAFASDHYGAHPPLSDKRRGRNFDPDAVEDFFADLEPEALELLRYSNRGDEGLKMPERFPWQMREAAEE